MKSVGTGSQPVKWPASSSTNARHRSLILSEQQRGNPYFTANTCLGLQFLPSAICYCLALETPLTLGRPNSLNFTDILDLTTVRGYQHGVSYNHCLLRREDQHVLIMDRGSAHGTYLNGRRLNPGQGYQLADGDRIVLGTPHANVFFANTEHIDPQSII